MWASSPAPAKRPLQRHSHTAFEITAVLSGGGTYETKKGSVEFKEGDVFVFSSNETHYITEVCEQGLTILNLHFEPRYLWGKSYDSPLNLNFCFVHSDDFSVHIKAQDGKEIFDAMHCIKQEFETKQGEYILAIRTYVMSMLISLIRKHKYVDQSDIEVAKNRDIVRTIEYIDMHLDSPLTLEELSRVAGNSPTYFSGLFKKSCGITLWDYITARRVEKAVSLLCEANEKLTVLDIATRCGFNNTANFNKAFRKHTGMTPKQMRAGEMMPH